MRPQQDYHLEQLLVEEKKIQRKEYKESKRNIKAVFFSLTETIKRERNDSWKISGFMQLNPPLPTMNRSVEIISLN
jgi:hypothetical protein